MLVDPGDRVIVEDPCYRGARQAFRAAGAEVCSVPVDESGLDAGALGRNADGARLVYVTPSHQFPLGGIMPRARRGALLRWAERRKALILEDDYDSEYRHGGRPVAPLLRRTATTLAVYTDLSSPA